MVALIKNNDFNLLDFNINATPIFKSFKEFLILLGLSEFVSSNFSVGLKHIEISVAIITHVRHKIRGICGLTSNKKPAAIRLIADIVEKIEIPLPRIFEYIFPCKFRFWD